MPVRDTLWLSEDFLSTNVAVALSARESNAWAAEVPEDIFLDYVLPYSSMDEDRDGCRHAFRPLVAPLVQNATSIGEAALLVNKQLWEKWGIVFKPNQTPDILSPSQVAAAGYASCTGLSIFLVCALRSIGIPARVTGTPAWRSGKPGVIGGNHDWVEVWTDGVWSFTATVVSQNAWHLIATVGWKQHVFADIEHVTHWSTAGPTEYTAAGWNKTWFYPEPVQHQEAGSREHGIFATIWRATNTTFPLSWAPQTDYVNAVEVTSSYLKQEEIQPLSIVLTA